MTEKAWDRYDIGEFNDLPPCKLEPADHIDLVNLLMSNYCEQHYKQPLEKGTGWTLPKIDGVEVFSLMLFVNSAGEGVAVAQSSEVIFETDESGKYRRSYRPVRYFRFRLCEHKFETLDVRNCYVERRCLICGHHESIDSSD